MYETTFAGASQYGVAIWQIGVPLHNAFPPSAHREKRAQQPTALQPQVPGSTNTEWQSVRASHAASVATFAQGDLCRVIGAPRFVRRRGDRGPRRRFGSRMSRHSRRRLSTRSPTGTAKPFDVERLLTVVERVAERRLPREGQLLRHRRGSTWPISVPEQRGQRILVPESPRNSPRAASASRGALQVPDVASRVHDAKTLRHDTHGTIPFPLRSTSPGTLSRMGRRRPPLWLAEFSAPCGADRHTRGPAYSEESTPRDQDLRVRR